VEERETLFATSQDTLKLGVAVVVAGIVGYTTIPWLLGYLKKRTMTVFIVYRLLLAAVLLWLLSEGRLTP
jgi:undecaprenyl-diphosphatase